MKLDLRKRALCLLTALPFALTGCAADDDEIHMPITQPEKISFSWWGTEMRSDYTLEGIEWFEKDNEGVSVIPYSNDFTGYKENLDALMMSGKEYDVIQINSAWIDEYSPDGEGFYDLYELSDIIHLSNFTDTELAYGTRGGKLTAIPISLNAQTFYYNEQLLSDNGLTVPETWDDLFACAEVLRTKDVLVIDASSKSHWLALIAHEEQISGRKAFGGFDAENVRSMLEFEKELIDAGVFSRKEYVKEDFLNRKSAGVIMWVSDAQYYVAPINDRGGTAVIGDYVCDKDAQRLGWYVKPTSLYAISRSTEHPEEAARLVDFLLNNETMALLQDTEKGVPLSKSALETLEGGGRLKGVSFDASSLITNTEGLELMDPELEDTARIEEFFRLFDLWYYEQMTIEEAAETFAEEYPFK